MCYNCIHVLFNVEKGNVEKTFHEFQEGMKLMSKRNFSGERKTKD